jgi:hypothetical protein
MNRFIIRVDGCRGTGGGEIVEGDPVENFGVGPGVRIGPSVKFVVDPGEEGDGTGMEGESEGCGLSISTLVIFLMGEGRGAEKTLVDCMAK